MTKTLSTYSALRALFLGLGMVSLASGQIKPSELPQTGGIQGYLRAQALNDSLDNFARIMPEFLLRESDFVFDLDLFNGFMYDMHLYGVKLTTLDIKDRNFKIVKGEKEPRAVMDIKNTNVKGHLTGGF